MSTLKPSMYAVLEMWRPLLVMVAKSEAQALALLKNPNTTPEQLVKLHAMVSKQATQIRETREHLHKLYPDSF